MPVFLALQELALGVSWSEAGLPVKYDIIAKKFTKAKSGWWST
jgi:hypothetical protein